MFAAQTLLAPATFPKEGSSILIKLMSGPIDTGIEGIYQEVGIRIQSARRKLNLTQAALAEKVSLSRTSIANIERGEQRFMLHCLCEFASALRVPVERLLPTNAGPVEERVEAAIGTIADKQAADFIKAGLLKAKVIQDGTK
jgi:transcriptional regulator with XRE-family HTH domain